MLGSGALGGGSFRGGIKWGGSPTSGRSGVGCMGGRISGSTLDGSYSGLVGSAEFKLIVWTERFILSMFIVFPHNQELSSGFSTKNIYDLTGDVT